LALSAETWALYQCNLLLYNALKKNRQYPTLKRASTS